MKILISYFYMVRFFKPYMIPLSTALSDPKWYHDGKGKKHIFMDKNGVVNGIRIETLHPDNSCSNLCSGRPCKYNPETCEFLKRYYKQLEKINFKIFMKWAERFGTDCTRVFNLDHEPIIVLLVHEAPNNECSERIPLIKWFFENGYELEEFKKDHSY